MKGRARLSGLSLLLLLALPFSASGQGSGALHTTEARESAPPENAPLPHWCEDLGIRYCMGDGNAPPNSAQRVLTQLRREDPRRFVPPDLILQARFCEAARRREADSTLQATDREASRTYRSEHCGRRGPLANELTSMVFIPVDTVARAQLPRSGARVVVDCTGRHLQLRADLSWPRQLELIGDTLASVYQIAIASNLPRGVSPGEARSCDPEAVGAVVARAVARAERLGRDPGRVRVRADRSLWIFRRADGAEWEAASATSIPRQYVSAACLPAGAARSASGVVGANAADTVRLLLQSLAEAKDESDRANDVLTQECDHGIDHDSAMARGASEARLNAIMSRCNQLDARSIELYDDLDRQQDEA